MIIIEPPPISGFHALLPDGEEAPASENFTLSGTRTQLAAGDHAAPSEHVAHLRFHPADPDLDLPDRRGKFSEAERDNILCLLASPDGRFGSLQINASAQIYTCALGADHQITYRVPPEHHLWIQPTHGSIRINDIEASSPQIAKISDEREIVISGLTDSEFLLLLLR